MEIKEFYSSLINHCTSRNEFEDKKPQRSKCVDCKIRDFCYSPPDNIEKNQPIDEVIKIIQSS